MKILYVKTLLLFILGCSATSVIGQNYRLEAGITAGASNYLGDIGGKYLEGRPGIVDIKLRQTKPAVSLYAKYALAPRLGLRIGFMYAGIAGHDKYTSNPPRNDRNLNFRNTILEGSLTAEYEFYEAYNVGRNTKYRIDYNMYSILGAGFFMHNPQGEIGGRWYDLQPLKTERNSYSLTGISYILGFGMDFTIKRNYKIGFRFTTNLANTDYLDDVSGSYATKDKFNLLDDKDALAYSLSDQRLTDNDLVYNGEIRGNPKNKDAYLTAGINFAYVFKGQGAKYNRAFHNGYIRRRGGKMRVSRFFSF